ncbi:MAG: class I mannose-6-phosphate isomerase, partial [Planctomycetes bacterium]|nr:class I mannose-6-phosphate isomerase [Planctomycetota bacterium]
MYPLKFYEIYKPKIWGGRAIESTLAKRLPEGKIGESWEVSDHFDDVSVVRNGPLEGRTLRQIWQEAPEEVLGEALSSRGYREFPLLVKFIDATAALSVQVHPDDEYARNRDDSGESGKNEAWYILAAEVGSSLIAGVKPGTTKDEFLARLDEKTLEKCLHRVDVAAGDLVHVAAGTVHAIGEGILLCEIQQTSDATYRVWDWGRVGDDGKERPLHIEHALNVIDFQRGPVGTVPAQRVSQSPCRRDILDRCEYFVIEKIQARERFVEPASDERFYIFICVAGSGSLVCEGNRCPYT